jgi:hypothetical protein
MFKCPNKNGIKIAIPFFIITGRPRITGTSYRYVPNPRAGALHFYLNRMKIVSTGPIMHCLITGTVKFIPEGKDNTTACSDRNNKYTGILL